MDQEFTVTEIRDIRNGLLLYNGLHRPFGDGEIAFLLVRNQLRVFYACANCQ